MPDYKPPASLESEQTVLGIILLYPEKLQEIIEIIRPEDFYRTDHAMIYQAMLDLLEADFPVDLVTLYSHLKEKGQIEKVGGQKFLAGLSGNAGPSGSFKHHVQTVHDKSTLRRLMDAALTIAKDCQNEHRENVLEIVEKAQLRITEIKDGAKFKGGKNITKRVRAYMEVTEGNAEVTKLYEKLGLVTEGNKKAALMALHRMVDMGVCAKVRPGIYRKITEEVIRLRLSEAPKMGGGIDMRYPFGLEKWYVTFPKTIVLVGGEPDAGKTAILLNIARMNFHLAPIYYWSSEMGLPELEDRVANFEDYDPAEWDEKVKFHEQSENFADVVRLYPDAIHIIDNLELDDEFYRVGGLINDIWKALGKGVAIIGLHKDPGKSWALGGMGSAKRPRLYFTLEPKKDYTGSIMQGRKIKNWRDKLTNIKGKTFEFKLIRGCKILEWE